ncbi:unnamed protein product [Dovyalis caffra]|uniref:glutathione transferase n=1 Tax=Dovyalis caffra TaxID=77055 RepID=A0AAV1RF75_9ROSI|nr:unnamed protein product [Dovyalis caffra]
MSTCTARVLLCLSEKGLEYELVPVQMSKGAHKQQPYLSLNPFGQIPAFEDGDVSLFESRAICKYLALKHKDIGTDLLRSSSFAEATIVDLWMEVEAHQFNGPISAFIRQIFLNPMFGRAPDEKVIETETEKLGKILDVYEERLSKSKYLAGDYYTMVDMNHIPYLVYFMKTPYATVVTSRPHVSAWWKNVLSRPATIKVSSGMTL